MKDKPLPAEELKKTALSLGADKVGIARSGPVENSERFHDWLESGYAAGMDYMKRLDKERLDPAVLMPNAKSIAVIGVNYFSEDEPGSHEKRQYKVARYAHGEDYHDVLRRILKKLHGMIKENYGKDIEGRICVDSAPFMDIYWARKAGLGWQGKHTGLVSREFGNYLLIGSLILSAEVDSYDRPHDNHCGTCTRCIEACPTAAPVEPYVLDASKCISYWTIEAKEDDIPDTIARNLNGYVFGCDICISACPFNRFARPGRTPEFEKHERIDSIESGEVVDFDETEFKRLFKVSPILRAGLTGLKRNIKAAGRRRK
jgi:epoxyqueuosine reductase